MSEEHQNVLRKHRDELVQNLNPDRVLDLLNSADVLTDNDLSKINAGATRQKQVQELLDILRRGDDEGFPELLAALKKTKQNALAALLETPAGENVCRSLLAGHYSVKSMSTVGFLITDFVTISPQLASHDG